MTGQKSIVGRGENSGYQHFLFFLTMFLNGLINVVLCSKRYYFRIVKIQDLLLIYINLGWRYRSPKSPLAIKNCSWRVKTPEEQILAIKKIVLNKIADHEFHIVFCHFTLLSLQINSLQTLSPRATGYIF